MAKAAPDRCSPFIIGEGHPYPYDAPAKAVLDARIAALKHGLEAFAAYQEAEAAQLLPPEVRARVLKNDADAIIAVTLANRDESGFVDILSGMTMPCLVYFGEANGGYPRIKEFVQQMPNAKFFSLPDLDHGQAFFRSDLVLPHVIKFLAGVSEPAGAPASR